MEITFSALVTMPKPLTIWITRSYGIFFKEMGMSDHLTCLLRNLYTGQEATVRTGHRITDWFHIGKGVCQGCILSSYFLTYTQSALCEILGWMKHKLEPRLLAETSITSDMQMTTLLRQEPKKN